MPTPVSPTRDVELWFYQHRIPTAIQLARETNKYTVDPYVNVEFQAVVDMVPELQELDMTHSVEHQYVPYAISRINPPPLPCLHTLTLNYKAGMSLITQMLRAHEHTLRELTLVHEGLTTLLLPNDADILMEELHMLTKLTKLSLRADVRALNQPFIFQSQGRLRYADIILLDYTKDTIESIIACNRGTLLSKSCNLAFMDGESITYAQNPGPGRHFRMDTLSWLKIDSTGPLRIPPLADFFE